MINTLRKLISKITYVILEDFYKVNDALLDEQRSLIKNRILDNTPENIIKHGYSVFSQNEEDGILNEIFNRLDINAVKFLEFGVHPTENNTLNLLLNGGSGVWVDKGLTPLAKKISPNTKLKIIDEFVFLDNITEIYQKTLDFLKITEHKNLDLLSLDLDGNDLHLITKLLEYGARPKVFCLEYNAKFPPPAKITVKYNRNHIWQSDDYFGCSLQEYYDLLKGKHGYELITCNITGSNCFFVDKDYADRFKCYSLEELYQPVRYYLGNRKGKSSMNFLLNYLNES